MTRLITLALVAAATWWWIGRILVDWDDNLFHE